MCILLENISFKYVFKERKKELQRAVVMEATSIHIYPHIPPTIIQLNNKIIKIPLLPHTQKIQILQTSRLPISRKINTNSQQTYFSSSLSKSFQRTSRVREKLSRKKKRATELTSHQKEKVHPVQIRVLTTGRNFKTCTRIKEPILERQHSGQEGKKVKSPLGDYMTKGKRSKTGKFQPCQTKGNIFPWYYSSIKQNCPLHSLYKTSKAKEIFYS